METEVRILFVEDSTPDAELEERELRKAGLLFRSKRVWGREDCVRALQEFKPDIIISDYSLPDMDGLAALEIAKEICPDVPFIFVSGTIGEERAVESLKRGATDYVIKDRLEGLVIKVRRALKEAEERAENRRLEEQLRQSQKVEAVGRLAGGIAHDFNNLLTAIIGYSDILLHDLGDNNPLSAEILEIKKAGQRAATLTSQLLAFSRKQVLHPRVLDLNDVVADMDKMLRRLIGEDIELVTLFGPELGRVKADPGQTEQIIMNLAVNARDAMPQGGKLTIETTNAELDETFARKHMAVKPGPYVMLAVSDNGRGMDAETQSHLFEPFFTTKELGKGTGLGLSTVYGIVKQSGGNIWVYSEPGEGTVFKIYLPRVTETVETWEPSIKDQTEKLTGTETVLVVEDESVVRNLVRSVLQRNGYTVLEANHGEEALRIAIRHQGTIHLMVTDVVLPHMSGRQLAERMATIRSNVRVLYMSGYTDNAIVQYGVLDPGIAFLQKPFTPDALARKVREVLDLA
ncbi:MAG: response regulator [Acidobacteria bacterium]|nr:response regulator [Acidobacteriota bacterium]MCI0722533.1 response regulator [Acidobacteriota bacterium]